MHELIRNLLLLALAGAAATVVGSGVAWWRDEPRRIARMLKKALGAPAEMVIIARDRGLAAGFNLKQGKAAVLWEEGLRGLVYRLDQLVGAELMVDDQVVARAFRDEQRRALDAAPSEAKRVMLRLVFDSPAHPDFELPLWPPADPARIQTQTAFDAIQEARRWVSSVEALLRKTAKQAAKVAARTPPPEDDEDDAMEEAVPPPHPPAPPPRPQPPPPLPLFEAQADEDDDEDRGDDRDDPPWDDEPGAR
jgi:hypothetical protein